MVGTRGGSRALVVTVAVAAVVLLVCLALAFVLRPRPAGSGAPAGSTTTRSGPANPPLQCDHGPCTPIASTTVAGDIVQLLVDAQAASGRVRMTGPNVNSLFETMISQLGAKLTATSLSCVTGAVPACLVSGAYQGSGMLGEVFVYQAGDWARTSSFAYSDGGYLALRAGADGGQPTVLAVRQQCPTSAANSSSGSGSCPDGKVYLEVYSVNQDPVGCTRAVSRREDLPGWPTPVPGDSALRPCPD